MYFTTDTVANAVTADGASNDGNSFTFDEATTVTLDEQPWVDAFDTDTFAKFEAVVARPIEQTYVVDGEQHTFKKPSWALKEAAWSLDNKPYPLTHPNTRVVTDIDDIHGVHRRPRYVEDYDKDGDALVTDLYVPTNDDAARSFIEQYRAISVGVYNDLDWDTDEESVDAYQTDLYFDHAAGVRRGRCSLEDGCGLMTDSWTVETSLDGVATTAHDDAEFSVGDTVKWSWSNGMAHGRIVEVATSEGTELSAEGATRIAKADRPAYKIHVYREDDGEYRGHAVKLEGENDLQSWKGPTADSCNGVCHCGCHIELDDTHSGSSKSVDDIDLVPPEAAQNAAQRLLDARDDDEKDVTGMTDHGWSRAKQLASGEELSVSDIVGGTGAMAPWWSRHAPHTIEGSDGDYSLKRDEDTEWWKDNSYVAGLGWGGVSGYKWAIRKGNEIKRARGAEPNYDLDATYKTVAGVSFHSTRDGKLDESNIPNPPEHKAHYLYAEDIKRESSYPVVDGDGYLRRGNVKSAHELGARGGVDENEHDENLRALAREFESSPVEDSQSRKSTSDEFEGLTLFEEDFGTATIDETPFSPESFGTNDSHTTMSDSDNDSGSDSSIDLDSMVGGMTVDAIAEYNDHVEELVQDAKEMEDRIEVLESEKEDLEASLDEAEEKLQAFEEGEREPKSAVVDSILELTSAWDEDELMDLDRDELETKLKVAEDAAKSPATPDGGNGDETGEKATTDSESDEVDLDEYRSWR